MQMQRCKCKDANAVFLWFQRQSVYLQWKYLRFSPARFARRMSFPWISRGNHCIYKGNTLFFRRRASRAGVLFSFDFQRNSMYLQREYLKFSPARFARRGAVFLWFSKEIHVFAREIPQIFAGALCAPGCCFPLIFKGIPCISKGNASNFRRRASRAGVLFSFDSQRKPLVFIKEILRFC